MSAVTADDGLIQAMALGIINAARERWSLDPIAWNFPALSSEHRKNALLQARGAYAALQSHTALHRQEWGWIIANANEDRFRMWGDTGPEWTDERRKAILFARRDDAEAFARDDEDAWKILPQNIIRARSAVEDEAYELGKRDGYEEAIQELDIATGGDGEFKGSTIPGATVDVPAMKRRVLGRLAQPVIADVGGATS